MSFWLLCVIASYLVCGIIIIYIYIIYMQKDIQPNILFFCVVDICVASCYMC